MGWIDPKLSWNESDYGGIKEIRLPYDAIWKPVNNIITLRNSSDDSHI